MFKKIIIILLIIGILLLIVNLLLGGSKNTTVPTDASLTPTVFDQMPSEEVQSQQQGLDDQATAVYDSEFIDKYPWYNDIPEPNNDYFIGFDSEKVEFFINLYPKRSSSTPISEQEEVLKNRALAALKSIGVDTAKYKFVWSMQPK